MPSFTMHVNALSGSVAHIQAAVDTVVSAGGGIVHIPAGNYAFVASGSTRVNINLPSGGNISIIGAGIDTTILQMPADDSAPNTVMFNVQGLNGGQIRVSGITFKGRPNWQTSPTGDSGISLQSCIDFRVDNCSFWYMGAHGVSVADGNNMYGVSGGDFDLVSQGVVDHCEFYQIYKPVCTAASRGWGYGVFVSKSTHYLWSYNIYPDSPWNSTYGYGKYCKNVYIEDCYFSKCRHAVTGNFAAAYVLRHSTIEDMGMYANASTGHPNRTDTFGQYYCEIYNVTVEKKGTQNFVGPLVEGGSALIYNDTFINLVNYAELGSCEDTDGTPYHPKGHTKEVYIWSNTITDCGGIYLHSNAPDGCPAPILNVEYFLHAPAAEKNYVPYPYPHYLAVPPSEPPEDPIPPIPPPPASYYRVYATAETGGQVSPSGIHDVLLNQSFTITATADTDYLFDHWVCNGTYSHQDYTFTIPSGPPGAIYYVTAYFQSNAPVEPDPPAPPETHYFSVNIGSSTGGSTDLTGGQTLLAGQTLTVYATPNDNYRFAYWLLDGSNWGTSRTFTLAGVADTRYTLKPVFSFVPPPPPDKPFIPPSTNVGKLSSGRMLATLMKAQAKVKPIKFDVIFKKLKRLKV